MLGAAVANRIAFLKHFHARPDFDARLTKLERRDRCYVSGFSVL